MKKSLLFLTILALGLTAFRWITSDPVTVYVIGDSTASTYDANSYPRTGWGQVLHLYFHDSQVLVDNRALSGRSSKSFYEEAGAWDKTLAAMKSGDFLIIQFGHNDEKTDDPSRYTDPYTTYQGFLRKYIDEAKAKGAIPILATSIHRNGWSGTTIKDSHGNYPPAVRDLAQKENVPLLDMHIKTKALFEAKGQNYTTNQIFLNLPAGVFPNYPNGNGDNTHMQENGAILVAKLVAEEIVSQSVSFANLKVLADAVADVGYVVATANDDQKGKVLGAGINTKNDSVTLMARPSTGYALNHWLLDGQAVSEALDYTFYLDKDTIELKAEFVTGYKLTCSRVPSSAGLVSGIGTYPEGRTVTLNATPKEGWYFKSWEQDGQELSRENPYQFTLGSANASLQANFTDVDPASILNIGFSNIQLYSSDHQLQMNGESHLDELLIADLSGRQLYNVRNINAPALKNITLEEGIYLIRWKENGAFGVTKIWIQ